MDKKSYTHVEIILKTVERCNLNCSYCYFFHGGDQTYKKNPPFISKETIDQVAAFLAAGCKEVSIEKLTLDLHGGEPMLQKLDQFDAMCTVFREVVGPLVQLDLVLQTNGTIFSDDWVELFIKHNVFLGISCDGPQEYHDQFRLDHRGKGSYNKVKENFQKYREAFQKRGKGAVGLLCVINPSRDPKKIYRHFTRDLGAKFMDFLLPDYTHDTFRQDPLAYGRFLCEIFDAWVEDDDPSIIVRLLASIMQKLTFNTEQLDNYLQFQDEGYREFTISSNGKLGSIDVLRSAASKWMWQNDDIRNTTLASFLEGSLLTDLKKALQVLPSSCQTCCWQKICEGGYVINRYSKKTDFANPTVYCSGLKLLYAHIARYLVHHGYTLEKLERLLCV